MLRELVERQTKAIPYMQQLTDLGGPMMTSGVGYYGSQNPYVPGSTVSARVQTPISQREAYVHEQTYGGREPIDWLMDAVDFIVTSASSASYHFEDESGKQFVVEKDPNDPTTLEDAPFLLKNLFERPNPYMDYRELIELTLIDYLLVGNAYWVKWKQTSSNQPLALYRMAPSFVRIKPDQFGPAKYLYKLPGQQNEVEFDPTEILHFKRPNPHDPYYGVGIVKGGARAIDMEIALTDTLAHYYENQALPSGVVQTDRRVPRDVFNKLKSQLRSFYSGSPNAGRLMVLEAGLKFQTVSPTAGDALFAEMGAWSRDRILAMFKLNKGLLGMWDGQGDPKLADWQRLFDQKTMIPLVDRLACAVSYGLTQPGWGLKMCIDYEATQSPDAMIKRATILASMPGVKVHELREAAGLTPSTGDSDVDETVLNMPGPNLDATGQNGFPDKNLPGEPGRPPLPANTRKIEGVPPAKPGGNAAVSVKAILDGITMHQKALAPARTHVGDIQDAIPPEDTLHSERTLALDNLVADAERELQDAVHTLERGLLDASEGKAQGTMYQRVKNSKAWAQFRARVAEILQSIDERALSLANIHHSKAGYDPNLDVDYKKTAKDLVARENGGALSIVKNFKDQLMQDILKLQRHGANPGEFTRTITEAVDQWKKSNASLTALTEATVGYNEGTALVADNGGMNLLVSDGKDFDEPCAEANGQVWTPEYAREHSIEHPRCRRAFVPTTAEATV